MAAKMAASRNTSTCIWVYVIVMLVKLHGSHTIIADAIDQGTKVMNVGVVVDPNTRIGKEQRVGIEIAAEDFNSSSKNVKVFLHFENSSTSDPLQAAYSARKLVEENKVEAIIGTETWQEAALVGELGNQYEVPILSLAAAPKRLPSVASESFLVQMTSNYRAQISCISSLMSYYGWKRVVAVYEDDGYDGYISSMLDLLSQSLQDVGTEIEYRLALPPLVFMTDPKDMITEELAKVLRTPSRVFVVLHSSIQLATQLFQEANIMGLTGRDTAWIVTDSIADLLDSLNSTVITDMEGFIGIKRHYDESSRNFTKFSSRFILKFLSENPDEIQSFQPGIQALRAYDAMRAIEKASERMVNDTNSGEALLQGILSNKFIGLSGDISIKNGVSENDGMLFRIVNVVGKKYKELDFWSQETKFFEKLEDSKNSTNQAIHGSVNWPGNVNHVPKGWTLPMSAKPLKIGVPGRTSFDKFVKVDNFSNPHRTTYSGFCIDVFLEVVKIIEQSYALPYEFEAFYGTYDELVDHVHDKTYDAVVGDVTILADRAKYVEFTQPFDTSRLSMVVPLKSKEYQKALMFTKPFSRPLWLAALGTLFYTMLIVWVVERQNTENSNYEGIRTKQLKDAMWFTFSSLYFAHRGNIQSTLTRVVVVVWLFVVFVLTQSYTASLTSMLTVPLLEPKVKDIPKLIARNSPIGCDGDSFVWDYLVTVIGFRTENIRNISNEYDYPAHFANGSIVAAFLELPYEKVFLDQYCKTFTHTGETFSFGGQGFVFQKGSSLAADVSMAILKLSENGVLKELNDKWFPPACSSSLNDHDVERLKPQAFIGLCLIYGVISLLCLLFFMAPHIKTFISNYGKSEITLGDPSFWSWMTRVAVDIHAGRAENSEAAN